MSLKRGIIAARQLGLGIHRYCTTRADAIQRCTTGYSIEVTPPVARKLGSFRNMPGLQTGTTVNVTYLPGSSIQDTLDTCKMLVDAEMHPVAHLPVRSFASLDAVNQYLASLAKLGVDELLVLGGNPSTPVGELDNAMQILESGLIQQHQFARVGVAAHPEGHPDIAREDLESALVAKARWSQTSKVPLYYETQFCFEPEPILNWERSVRQMLRNELPTGDLPPVFIGVAGPAKMSALIKFGTMSGVGNSLRFLTKNAGNAFKLATTSTPDTLIIGIASHQSGEPDSLIQKLHFYPFGGFKTTLKWANAVAAGEFDMESDDGNFTVRD